MPIFVVSIPHENTLEELNDHLSDLNLFKTKDIDIITLLMVS